MGKLSRKNNRNSLKQDLSKVKDAISLTAQDVRAQAKDSFDTAKENFVDRTTDMQDSVADYIGDKPFKAMGIAVLSGLILGYAMRRKKRLKHYNSHR